MLTLLVVAWTLVTADLRVVHVYDVDLLELNFTRMASSETSPEPPVFSVLHDGGEWTWTAPDEDPWPETLELVPAVYERSYIFWKRDGAGALQRWGVRDLGTTTDLGSSMDWPIWAEHEQGWTLFSNNLYGLWSPNWPSDNHVLYRMPQFVVTVTLTTPGWP